MKPHSYEILVYLTSNTALRTRKHLQSEISKTQISSQQLAYLTDHSLDVRDLAKRQSFYTITTNSPVGSRMCLLGF